MKVGILTFHDTANYGAALQAYATQKAIEHFGYHVEIINYTNGARSENYSAKRKIVSNIEKKNWKGAVKNLLGSLLIIRRNRNFGNFYKNNLNLSSTHYISKEEIDVNPPKYDIYVVGSDQVWNFSNNGADPSYALEFVHDKSRTMSYASSFGLIEFPEKLKAKFSDNLSSISCVSVRESAGARLYEEITDKTAKVVLDPVFLIDQEQWLRDLSVVRRAPDSRILLYMNEKKQLRDFYDSCDVDFSGNTFVQMSSDISLGDLLSPSIRFRSTAGPKAFVENLVNSQMVLTTSFHGIVLSILFEVPFIAFLSGNPGRDSRILDLLERFDLADRIFDSGTINSVYREEIDYVEVSRKLSLHKDESVKFLRDSLKKISENGTRV